MQEKRFAKDLSAVLDRLHPRLSAADYARLFGSPSARVTPKSQRRNRKPPTPRSPKK